MTKALTTYNPSLARPNLDLIILIAIIGLVVYFVMKSKGSSQYKNLERWEIKRNEQGFATEIVVHRDAHTS